MNVNANRRSVEKAKLVYVLNRNSEGKLFPSSPLEAHKNNTLVTHIVAVDQGYDNPLYAALEVDYHDSDEDPTGQAMERTQKVRSEKEYTSSPPIPSNLPAIRSRRSLADFTQNLTFYELDLGLNHVVRKWSEPTDRRANMLVQGELKRMTLCF